MRTKEFIKRIEELGFEVWISGSIACVLKNGRYTVARIKTKRACAIDFFYLLNESLDEEISEKLFDIIVEYAKTPIEDREEEKKFWIQHKFMVSKNLLPVNLVWNKLKDVYRSINLKVDNHIYQAQFTFKEYEEIKKKLNTDLKDFELVEVTDE